METLTLNDGTVLEGSILEDGIGLQIYVYLTGMDMMRGFALLSDQNKTSTIVAKSYDVEKVYTGYTALTAINNQFGNCNATLQRKG